jgi:hypothetical protein
MTGLRTLAAISVAAPALLLALGCAGARKDPPMPKFAILMYETDDAWHRKPQEEKDALMQRYIAWVKGLRASGAFSDGSPVGRGGIVLAQAGDGPIVSTPLDTNAESLTGYFIIEARDLAHAEELARSCPAIGHGETVHVRPVGHD